MGLVVYVYLKKLVSRLPLLSFRRDFLLRERLVHNTHFSSLNWGLFYKVVAFV